MTDNYTPRPGSLAGRVCAWFKAHPGKRLVSSEICARFGATASNMAAQLGAAEDADLLASELVGRSNVYFAGPKLAKWNPAAEDIVAASAADSLQASVAAPAAPVTAPRRAPSKPLDCSPDDLVIEDGIPLLPAGYGPNAVGRFDDKFASMKVGQSFQRPHEQAKKLKDSADRWSKRHHAGKVKFAIRRLDDDNSRVWRTE